MAERRDAPARGVLALAVIVFLAALVGWFLHAGYAAGRGIGQ